MLAYLCRPNLAASIFLAFMEEESFSLTLTNLVADRDYSLGYIPRKNIITINATAKISMI